MDYRRRRSSVVRIGKLNMGGEYPIRVQSMGTTSTLDTIGAVEQAIRIVKAGGELIRFTAQGIPEAENLGEIRKELDRLGYENVPLVADIHFNPKAAEVAAVRVEKVRINPGNFVDGIRKNSSIHYTEAEYQSEQHKIKDRFIPFLRLCKEHGTAIRIGVNHGSLSDRMMSRYGNTTQGMVESCMEFLRICVEEQFNDVVISMKSSNTGIMVESVRRLVRSMEQEQMFFPLHLGVTEAGEGEDGRIRSAVGIGALLADGIGDTIRVSLSEAPEAEIPVAQAMVRYIEEQNGHKPIDGTIAEGYDWVCPQRYSNPFPKEIILPAQPVVMSEAITLEENNPNADFCFEETMAVKNASGRIYPIFTAKECDEQVRTCESPLFFVRMTAEELVSKKCEFDFLKDQRCALILRSEHQNRVGELKAAFHLLMQKEIHSPVIVELNYPNINREDLPIRAAMDAGALLLSGFGDGLFIRESNNSCSAHKLTNLSFGILQAARLRISRTEYISCPGCGRTLYDLQTTVAEVKRATSHLKGLKIAVMGCIVNGPGEMTDADYGYVGSRKGEVDLYKGKICVEKRIPQDKAIDKLLDLIGKAENK